MLPADPLPPSLTFVVRTFVAAGLTFMIIGVLSSGGGELTDPDDDPGAEALDVGGLPSRMDHSERTGCGRVRVCRGIRIRGHPGRDPALVLKLSGAAHALL